MQTVCIEKLEASTGYLKVQEVSSVYLEVHKAVLKV